MKNVCITVYLTYMYVRNTFCEVLMFCEEEKAHYQYDVSDSTFVSHSEEMAEELVLHRSTTKLKK